MDIRLVAARGAVQVGKDDAQSMTEAVCTLFDAVVEANNIDLTSMVSVMFTVTGDLCSINPATALRTRRKDFPVPLLCMQEPEIAGMMPRVVRMLVHYHAPAGTSVAHVYLEGARKLRPDLA